MRRRREFGDLNRFKSKHGILDVPLKSYQEFLYGINEEKAKIEEFFQSIFPITDSSGTVKLEFISYSLDEPIRSPEECKKREFTYSSVLKIKVKLTNNEHEEIQNVYIADIPLMLPSGSFIISGVERVIVSQLHRSPGSFFDKIHDVNGKIIYCGRIVPRMGSWIDFECDYKGIMYVKIDRKRRFPASILLMSLRDENNQSYSKEYLMNYFYSSILIERSREGVFRFTDNDSKYTISALYDQNMNVLYTAGQKTAGDGKVLYCKEDELINSILAKSIYDTDSGELLHEAGNFLQKETIDNLHSLYIVNSHDCVIAQTFAIDKNTGHTDSLLDFHRCMRQGQPPTVESAEKLLKAMFFDADRYDLSRVGRFKMNLRFGGNNTSTLLTSKDILNVVKYLLRVVNNECPTDDIDHLSNRRVRCVGELILQSMSLIKMKFKKSINEKLNIESRLPRDVINGRYIIASLRDFFNSSQLSQYMEHTNPTSELTHKRRLSALGQGGVTRSRAGLEVRDVHDTHYGRICTIETPEGQNVGLICSLASCAHIDEYGFLQTPYRIVNNGNPSDQIQYFSALGEMDHKIAYVGELKDEQWCRSNGEHVFIKRQEITLQDVTPDQTTSSGGGRIPFLKHDNAYRGLGGTNMQRQAVPLVTCEAPLIGTGTENEISDVPGVLLKAIASGIVTFVDSEVIFIKRDDLTIDHYELKSFEMTNAGTCIRYKPIVVKDQYVHQGEVLSDGFAIDNGEIALGKNLKVAFMSWRGYGFEDAIIISEAVVRDDTLTSIHMQSFDITFRDTKLGAEELTREVAGNTAHLDESGIVQIGSHVKSGDILVGRLTPRGNNPIEPEEKLLKCIFMDQSSDFQDTSLHIPSGVSGTIVDIQIFTRYGVDKDESALALEEEKTIKIRNIYNRKLQILNEHRDSISKEEYEKKKNEILTSKKKSMKSFTLSDELPSGVLKVVKVMVAIKRRLQPGDKMAGRHGNKGVVSRIVPVEDMPYLSNGEPVDIILNTLGVPSRMNIGQIFETNLGWASYNLGKQIDQLMKDISTQKKSINLLKEKLNKIYSNKTAEVNKMNDQEIISFASKLINGVPMASPSFDGAKENEISELLKEAARDANGQEYLYDGITGERFDRKITVGIIYMMKLHHLVDEKMHARSTGPYSLITQQPLGGKSHDGGQRLGEMEVWALEAHGAARILQEMLTIKSDDISGRSKAYKAIITRSFDFRMGIPESFNVLVKYMHALGINLRLTNKNTVKISIANNKTILGWSKGEVKRAETINYRTLKPEKDGLFCAKIFGPVNDYECLCGKYKRIQHSGKICEKCGVKVDLAIVRRQNLGHINLCVPVAHPWFARALPSRIARILDMTIKDLSDIILYNNKYIVTDPGTTDLVDKQIMTHIEYEQYLADHPEGSFEAYIGAEAIYILLKQIDLQKEINHIHIEIQNASDIKKKRLLKRLEILNDLFHSENDADSMILFTLPVLPPDLRPLVSLGGGRFVSSDLNDLYRKVINRNTRLKKLIDINAPSVIISNEKRMLQESVDALFENNSKKGKQVTDSNKRPLVPLDSILKGKMGLFRRNLLGKRVDFSGRSVIVVGPSLKLDQCGIPKIMALGIFQPFVCAKLKEYGIASSIKEAKKLIKSPIPEVIDTLKEVMHDHPVLLNRAPTLHRLGIQAFRPVLVEGNAIHLHPLVCAAYNADFDGDQMAVHVPLSIEAQVEALVLMTPDKNILSPANGKPTTVPSNDIVIGLYYLTQDIHHGTGTSKGIFSKTDIIYQYQAQLLQIHDKVTLIFNQTKYETTVGRVIFASILPEIDDFNRVNLTMTKQICTNLIEEIYIKYHREKTYHFLNEVMALGFQYATLSGISIGRNDMIIPPMKKQRIEKVERLIKELNNKYKSGLITASEKYNQSIALWMQCSEDLTNDMEELLKDDNSFVMLAKSGARGSKAQMRQSMAISGLIAKNDGSIIEKPITSNLKEGLSYDEFFLSTYGSRKGLSDTALKTSNAGYLTRKMVDVTQECVIKEHDCRSLDGLNVLISADDTSEVLTSKIVGRTLASDIVNSNNEVMYYRGTIIDNNIAQKITTITSIVKVRSPILCNLKEGICALCYGWDLSRRDIAEQGTAVGVIAAQSIGEPGTQLTMNTFHAGGAAQSKSSAAEIISLSNGVVEFDQHDVVSKGKGKYCVISHKLDVKIDSLVHHIPRGSIINIDNGQQVVKGQVIGTSDPHFTHILSKYGGKISFVDLVVDVTLNQVQDIVTGETQRSVTDNYSSKLRPRIVVTDNADKSYEYDLCINTMIDVEEGQNIAPGTTIARISKTLTKSQDITGGLPKIIELFEARTPNNPAIMTHYDGILKIDYERKNKIRIHIYNDNDFLLNTYSVHKSRGGSMIVQNGERVKSGDILVEGTIYIKDILLVHGINKFAEYFIDEIQSVYRSQEVIIDNKHIECIARSMVSNVEVIDAGDSEELEGSILSIHDAREKNMKFSSIGKKVISYIRSIQGITTSALNTDSFLSNASFQETIKVSTNAAIRGQEDQIKSVKENIITGKLAPVGTGASGDYQIEDEENVLDKLL